jgi:tRNA(Ile)-lysidine synthase
MQTLRKKLEDFVQREALFTRQDRLVVGVSGGLDSVVLAHLLMKLEYGIELAHINYGLRGEESDRDEAFVRQLALEWKLPVHVKKIDAAKSSVKEVRNIQEWARELRYQWFQEIIQEEKLIRKGRPGSYIVVAHHADDQAETILQNLVRGSGLNGIKGMLPKRKLVCRPLLFAEREELEQYAKEEQLTWVEDSSNATDKYNRNKIRQQLLPLIKEIYPDSIRRIYLNSRNFQSLAAYTEQQVGRSLKKLIQVKGEEQWLPVRKWKLSAGGRYLLFEWLHAVGFSADQVEQAIALMDSQSGQSISNGEFQLLKNRNWLILSRREEQLNEWLVLEKEEGEISFAGGRLSWKQEEWKGQTIPDDSSMALLNAKDIQFPLLLRKWAVGDYFYPLGMPKKKKIARFLIDQKISRSDKEKVWVLETGKKICWVVGHRIDDRFKITPFTRRVIVFRLVT